MTNQPPHEAKGNESITAALYHLKLAFEYLGVFKLDCHDGAKGRAINWERKAKWILDDVFASLTPISRDLYRKEISQGDPIFIGAMAKHLLTMTPEQRDQIEKVAEGMASGKISQLEFLQSAENTGLDDQHNEQQDGKNDLQQPLKPSIRDIGKEPEGHHADQHDHQYSH